VRENYSPNVVFSVGLIAESVNNLESQEVLIDFVLPVAPLTLQILSKSIENETEVMLVTNWD